MARPRTQLHAVFADRHPSSALRAPSPRTSCRAKGQAHMVFARLKWSLFIKVGIKVIADDDSQNQIRRLVAAGFSGRGLGLGLCHDQDCRHAFRCRMGDGTQACRCGIHPCALCPGLGSITGNARPLMVQVQLARPHRPCGTLLSHRLGHPLREFRCVGPADGRDPAVDCRAGAFRPAR